MNKTENRKQNQRSVRSSTQLRSLTEIPTFPFLPESSRFWRSFLASRFHSIIFHFVVTFRWKGKECCPSFTSLLNIIICLFLYFLISCSFFPLFSVGSSYFSGGNFWCSNALDYLGFVESLGSFMLGAGFHRCSYMQSLFTLIFNE